MWQFLQKSTGLNLLTLCRTCRQCMLSTKGQLPLSSWSKMPLQSNHFGGTQQPMSIFQQIRTISVNQLHRRGPFRKNRKYNPKATHPMDHRPQMKGVVIRTLIRKPKKPNSANRKCVKVRMSNGKEVIAFIPGEGHNLQEHNIVLVEGGRTQDLIGVKHKIIRGKYDCNHVVKKKK